MIDLSNGQTDSQLEDVCLYKNIDLTGIYMINDFDFNKNGNYILNLDNDDRGGTHWVACIINNKYIFYFDSFGYKPPEIIKSKFKFCLSTSFILVKLFNLNGLKKRQISLEALKS